MEVFLDGKLVEQKNSAIEQQGGERKLLARFLFSKVRQTNSSTKMAKKKPARFSEMLINSFRGKVIVFVNLCKPAIIFEVDVVT